MIPSPTPPLTLRPVLVPLLVGCLCLTRVLAQTPAPAEDEGSVFQPLELAQLSFHRSLLVASIDPLRDHLSDLDQLATSLAQQRRYEEALLAQKEHQAMELELDRINKEILLLESKELALRTSLLPDQIVLPLSQATLSGVVLDPKDNSITQWERPGDSAEWRLPDIPAGGYEVVLNYTCSAVEGGLVELAESRFTLSAEMDTTLRGPESKMIGTLKITDGSGTLKIAARSVIRNNLMHLLGVQLIPANR